MISLSLSICIYTHMHMHIYIYIYVWRDTHNTNTYIYIYAHIGNTVNTILTLWNKQCMASSCSHPRPSPPNQLTTQPTLRFLAHGSTANLRTKILDFRGFVSSRILILRGGILLSVGDFPESLSQAILVGRLLVGRLGA